MRVLLRRIFNFYRKKSLYTKCIWIDILTLKTESKQNIPNIKRLCFANKHIRQSAEKRLMENENLSHRSYYKTTMISFWKAIAKSDCTLNNTKHHLTNAIIEKIYSMSKKEATFFRIMANSLLKGLNYEVLM